MKNTEVVEVDLLVKEATEIARLMVESGNEEQVEELRVAIEELRRRHTERLGGISPNPTKDLRTRLNEGHPLVRASAQAALLALQCGKDAVNELAFILQDFIHRWATSEENTRTGELLVARKP